MPPEDRVRTALQHREPDRIPIFAPNIINTREPYDRGLRSFLDQFPFDQTHGCGVAPGWPSEKHPVEEDITEDEYGCRFHYMGVGLPYCVHSPLADAQSVDDVDAFAWPDPQKPGRIPPDLVEHARARRQETGGVIGIRVPPLFHTYHYVRSFEQWMIDIRLNRNVHGAIATHIYHIHKALLLQMLEHIGPYVDMVSTGDDLGHSTAPYMSRDDFRALILPFYADLVQTIKSRWPHLRFYLHSHGQITDFVPDLVACGVDVLNPVLPLDHMEPVPLKRNYGDSLCFHGAVDIEHIVPFGTVEQVRDHVKQVIDIMAPGGGYWFKAQAISPVMPPENVIAAYETALKYGEY